MPYQNNPDYTLLSEALAALETTIPTPSDEAARIERQRLSIAKMRMMGHAARTARKHMTRLNAEKGGYHDGYDETLDPRQSFGALEIREQGPNVVITNTAHPDWKPKYQPIFDYGPTLRAALQQDESETQATPSTAEQQAS